MVFVEDELLGVGGNLVVVASFSVGGAYVLGVVVLGVDWVAGGIVGTRQQRRRAILLTTQIGAHSNGILGGILVERCIGVGADNKDEERRVADHQQQQAHQGGIGHLAVLAFDDEIGHNAKQHEDYEEAEREGAGTDLGGKQQHEYHGDNNDVDRLARTREMGVVPHTPHYEKRNKEEEHDCTRVESEMQLVDEEDVKVARQVHDARYHAPEYGGKYDQRYKTTDSEAFECRLGILLEVNNVYYGRDCQEVQQVHSDGHTHKETDENQPTKRMLIVGLLFPLQDGPEHNCGKER